MRVNLLLVCLLLVGCEQAGLRTTSPATAQSPTSPTYSILQEKTNPALGKANVDIRLPTQVNEDELRRIAQAIHATHQAYTRLFIAYYLPGMKPGAGAWATTNFTPDLEVRVWGASQAEEARAKRATVAGKVLGRWYETQYTQSSLIIYQLHKQYHLKTTFQDGTSSEQLLRRHGNIFTYAEPGSFNGEYFRLLPDGQLGLLNKEGKQFSLATPVQ